MNRFQRSIKKKQVSVLEKKCAVSNRVVSPLCSVSRLTFEVCFKFYELNNKVKTTQWHVRHCKDQIRRHVEYHCIVLDCCSDSSNDGLRTVFIAHVKTAHLYVIIQWMRLTIFCQPDSIMPWGFLEIENKFCWCFTRVIYRSSILNAVFKLSRSFTFLFKVFLRYTHNFTNLFDRSLLGRKNMAENRYIIIAALPLEGVAERNGCYRSITQHRFPFCVQYKLMLYPEPFGSYRHFHHTAKGCRRQETTSSVDSAIVMSYLNTIKYTLT